MSDERTEISNKQTVIPAITVPTDVADLADEMATDAEGKSDGRIIAPRLMAARAKIRQSVQPLTWLGFEDVARRLEDIVTEINALIGDDQ